MGKVLHQVAAPTRSIQVAGGTPRSERFEPVSPDAGGDLHLSALAAEVLVAEREAAQARERATMMEAARIEAYQEGLIKARAEIDSEWRARISALERVVEAFEAAREELATVANEDAVAIAFEALIRVVGERKASRDAIAETVRQVRKAQGAPEPITVRVAPADYEVLIAEPALIDLEEKQGRISLSEDPRVLLGGCLVETRRGTIDARLDTQLRRLHELLSRSDIAARDTQ